MNFIIDNDEVLLYQGHVWYNGVGAEFTLTSKKMVFEVEKGFFKKVKEVYDIVYLNDIKVFNGEVQCKQKSDKLNIQTNNKVFDISFSSFLEAKKVCTKIIDILTGTTMAERGSDKVSGAIDLVDKTLGLDTREITRGFFENGLKGTIINGIKKRKGKK